MSANNKKKIWGLLTFIGVSGIALWLLSKVEIKSNFMDLPDLVGGGQGAANSLQFTMKNNTRSPQTINIFDSNSLKTISNQNPELSISSTPSLDFFIQDLHKHTKKMDRIDIRSSNPQQLIQTFNLQAKDANGKMARRVVQPMQSTMQVQSNISTADVSGLYLSPATQIHKYTILPGTAVTMIIYWL